MMRQRLAVLCATLGALVLLAGGLAAREAGQERGQSSDGFRFRSGVDLVNVTATVTDRSGRFVRGLDAGDFVLHEEGEPQTISHFSNERVPVSLGIAVDTSGSMAGEPWRSARLALERFLFELLDPADEIFLFRFADYPELVESWTSDRDRLARGLGRITPRGGTALYDTVAEAVPLAHSGAHRKKALLVISDGNDTSSATEPRSLVRLVQESEVLVYAIGLDQAERQWTRTRTPQRRLPIPFPFPIPGRRSPWPPQQPPGGGGGTWTRGSDAANIAALRELTDDSGGRTEVIRDASDLDPATASIADELSQQYYIGYETTRPKDGRWHDIELRVRGNHDYIVRARRGYIASQ
jgi:Ca-activated chloride channel family protein